MKCSNHPDREATAICTECGKAVCNECVSSKAGLCKNCYKAYLQGKIATAVFYLIALTIIGIVGYHWDLMGYEDRPNQAASCYMLMSTCTGIFLLSGKIRIPAITFLAAGANNVGIMLLLVMIVKFVIAVVLGSILTPFVFIWQITTIVLSISRIQNNKSAFLKISGP